MYNMCAGDYNLRFFLVVNETGLSLKYKDKLNKLKPFGKYLIGYLCPGNDITIFAQGNLQFKIEYDALRSNEGKGILYFLYTENEIKKPNAEEVNNQMRVLRKYIRSTVEKIDQEQQ